jgi:plastocyanin
MTTPNSTRRSTPFTLGLSSLAAVLVLALVAGCPAPPPPVAGTTDVTMRGLSFDPMVVTISQGQTVRWTNTETLPIPHTVTSGNPEDANAGSIFDSGLLNPGQSFSFTFNTPGTYVYFCRIHFMEGMRDAQVIVTP